MDYYGGKKTSRKKAFTGYHSDGGSGYSELPLYKKRDISNERDIDELRASGLLDEFEKYRKQNSLWEKIKSAGSGALDILQRPEYATVAGVKASQEGGDAKSAVLRELLSGIGDVKGEKQTWGERFRETNPSYKQFSEEHPIASIGTDLAASIAGDPTTYIPSSFIAKAGKGVIRGGKAVAKAVTPDAIKGTLGRTFSPQYLWRKGAENMTGNAELGQKAYDTVWQAGKETEALRNKYGKKFSPVIKQLREAKTGDEAARIVSENTDLWREVGRRDYRNMGRLETVDDAGNVTTPLRENYFPNKPKSYTDLMDEAGDYSASGHGRAMSQNPSFTKGKVLPEVEDVIGFMREKGVAEENIGEAFARSFETRLGESANVFRSKRIYNRLFRDVPELFKELPLGTRTPWAGAGDTGEALLKKGETILMPNGNLRFFPQDVISQNSKIREAIDSGSDLVLTPEELKELSKSMVGVTTQVKAYAVPKEIHEAIVDMDKRLASKDNLLGWWDKGLSLFKNTAILSPGFHIRNFISSGAQNYLAGMRPERYGDAVRVFMGKDNSSLVMKKSVGGWKSLMDKYGISHGSFVGQDVGKSGIPVLGKVFDINRAVGGNIETLHRAALFMDGVERGMTPLEAAKRVKKYHFDYNELTTAEREGFRRLMPFYTWCVSEDTECLTLGGWKKHNEVEIGETILTYNTQNKTWEWLPVTDKFVSTFNHKLLNFQGKSIDLLCTFDHKCVTNNGLREAYTVAQNDVVPMTATYKMDDSIIPDNILKIICWIITDGYSRMRGGSFEAVIYQKKPEHVTQIRELLGENCHESIHPRTGVICFRINGELRKQVGEYYTSKDDIWKIFVALSPRQMKMAQEVMMNAEGSCSYKDTQREFRHFAQLEGKVMDAFQLLTILGGTISNISKRGIYLRNKENVKYPKPDIVDYNGIIWCPTTDNGTWVARRNGKVIITGNSRKNIPLQLESIMTAPKKYRNIAKLKEAVAGGETSEYQPDWWKDQDVWETKFANDKGERAGVAVNLPYSDLNIANRAFSGMLGPAGALKNLADNYDPFREEQIKQFPGQRKPVIMTEKMAVNIPVLSQPQVDYALRNLIPLYNRLTGAGSSLAAKVQGEPGSTYKLVSQAFLKVMPLVKEKQEKQRIYKLMNELRDFEKYRAQQEGGNGGR